MACLFTLNSAIFSTPVKANSTLSAESFAGRNFRDFRDFGPLSRKLMPGKKLDEKFAKVIFAKRYFFSKIAKVFAKLEIPKIRKKDKEKCRNSLVLRKCRLSRQTIKQGFQKMLR